MIEEGDVSQGDFPQISQLGRPVEGDSVDGECFATGVGDLPLEPLIRDLQVCAAEGAARRIAAFSEGRHEEIAARISPMDELRAQVGDLAPAVETVIGRGYVGRLAAFGELHLDTVVEQSTDRGGFTCLVDKIRYGLRQIGGRDQISV